MKLGGYVKLDGIYDFQDAGNRFLFDPNSIPVDGGRGEQSTLDARQSRLFLDTTTPLDGGDLRIRFEADFFDDFDGQGDFRLRLAFGEYGNFLAGKEWVLALGLVLACILLSVPAHLMEMPTLRITQDVLTILLFAHIVRLIIRALFRRRIVDYDTIAASLCGYLLIGVGFAVVYSLVIEINADAIRIPLSADVQAGTMRFGDHTTGTALYFSFVTLTTLGYGDIAAVSMPARLLTTAEAVIGQFYLVVLVARLVGLHITNEMRGSCDE